MGMVTYFLIPKTLQKSKNYYFQLMNVNGVNDFRQIEMHRAKLLIHDPKYFEDEIVIAK
jgi:hypothetical protein